MSRDRAPGDRPLLPSVFDRLCDDDDDVVSRPPAQVARRIYAQVRRDLEDLLNTRRPYPPDTLPGEELPTSLFAYGIGEHAGRDIDSPDAVRDILDDVARVIEVFEPRLKDVRLEPTDRPTPTDPTLKFRITATLSVTPLETPVRYESNYETATSVVRVGDDD